MNQAMRARMLGTAIVAALAIVVASVPLDLRADTRSDYNIICLDLAQYDPGLATYPYAENSSSGSMTVPGGSFDWDLFSAGQMPGAGIPYLTQGADAWARYQNVTIPFGAGCQFFSGNESRINIRGTRTGFPDAVGSAPAQIRVHYHVILETEYLGNGGRVGASNGINVIAPNQFGSASLSLSGTGGTPALMVPPDATVTDVSMGNLTRKEVEGVLVVSDMLSYGTGVLNQVDITFFAGTQASAIETPVAVTGEAASMGAQTALTEVVSLDPDVVFTVVPEPGADALGALAIGCVAALGARRKARVGGADRSAPIRRHDEFDDVPVGIAHPELTELGAGLEHLEAGAAQVGDGRVVVVDLEGGVIGDRCEVDGGVPASTPSGSRSGVPPCRPRDTRRRRDPWPVARLREPEDRPVEVPSSARGRRRRTKRDACAAASSRLPSREAIGRHLRRAVGCSLHRHADFLSNEISS